MLILPEFLTSSGSFQNEYLRVKTHHQTLEENFKSIKYEIDNLYPLPQSNLIGEFNLFQVEYLDSIVTVLLSIRN